MIEASGLVRRFGDFVAVDHVTLHVPDGTILALLGPNGAGKTTTVRMLAGLLAPSAGMAVVAGFDVRRSPAAVRARVGLVTDVPGLYEQMNLPSYLDFFGAIYGIPREQRARRIDELLAFFDLTDHRKERMSGFSKGMKQKVALARALLHEPAALFLDEPTSGLDPLATRAVRDLIVELKHSSRSIILCTHDLDEAERLADQVAIMRRGQIAAYDTPGALRAQASPETTVRVDLAVPCAAAAEAVRAIAGVLGVEDADGVDAEHTTQVIYRTAAPAKVNPRVVARLVDVGAAIVTLTSSMRSLEDVYADAMSADDLIPGQSPTRSGEMEGGHSNAMTDGATGNGVERQVARTHDALNGRHAGASGGMEGDARPAREQSGTATPGAGDGEPASAADTAGATDEGGER